jgi:hypothetical protein
MKTEPKITFIKYKFSEMSWKQFWIAVAIGVAIATFFAFSNY